MDYYGLEMQGDLKIKVLSTRPVNLEEGKLAYIQDEEAVTVGSSSNESIDVNPISSITQQPGAPTTMVQFDSITVMHDSLSGKEGQAMFGVMEEIGGFYTAMGTSKTMGDFRIDRISNTSTLFTKTHAGAAANVIATVTIK